MRKLILATAAAVGLAVSAGGANATLTYTIWNGTGLNHDAVFPLPGSAPLVSFTSTVDTLNFRDNSPFPTDPTFGVFDNGQRLFHWE